MSLLQELLEHETQLQFDSFSNQSAWEIGQALKQAAESRSVSVAIDVTLNGQCLFSYSMPGTSPDNQQWIRRKQNVVNRYHHSSMYIGEYYRSKGTSLAESSLVDPLEFADHGGCFPLIIKGCGVVGSISVSGLPQLEDHQLVVDVIHHYLSTKPTS